MSLEISIFLDSKVYLIIYQQKSQSFNLLTMIFILERNLLTKFFGQKNLSG